MSWVTAAPTVDLPAPDSPTMASVSPGKRSSDTSLTAGTSPVQGSERDGESLDLQDGTRWREHDGRQRRSGFMMSCSSSLRTFSTVTTAADRHPGGQSTSVNRPASSDPASGSDRVAPHDTTAADVDPRA